VVDSLHAAFLRTVGLMVEESLLDGLMEVTCGDYSTHACRANHRCVLRGPNCVSPENDVSPF
jgi:hypothetical protein